jgi:hypothetical protein
MLQAVLSARHGSVAPELYAPLLYYPGNGGLGMPADLVRSTVHIVGYIAERRLSKGRRR